MSQQLRHYLITGANTGIGFETAKALSQVADKLSIVCRSLDKAQATVGRLQQEARSCKFGAYEMDLGRLESIRACADQILQTGENIDCLVNNAGLAGARGQTHDGFEVAFGVNHLGPFLFTNLLMPKVTTRVVMVASRAHYGAKSVDFDAFRARTRSMTGFPEYQVSKLCNVLFAKELDRRQSGVSTYALHPGVVASDIWRRMPWPVRVVAKRFMIGNQEGAQTSIHCATSPEVAEESGLYYDKCQPKEPSDLAKDEELARRLWEKSAEWVGLA